MDSFDCSAVPSETYAYLLGMYLGDGYITANGSSWSLRITLDQSYPGIICSCCDAIGTISGRRPVPYFDRRGTHCVVGQSTWRLWIRLSRSTGPEEAQRQIRLEPWQQEIVDAAPQAFLRGLIQTDGWRGVNRVHVKGKDYAYPRYQFSNRSDDIRRLFTDTSDRLGIKSRQLTDWSPLPGELTQE